MKGVFLHPTDQNYLYSQSDKVYSEHSEAFKDLELSS